MQRQLAAEMLSASAAAGAATPSDPLPASVAGLHEETELVGTGECVTSSLSDNPRHKKESRLEELLGAAPMDPNKVHDAESVKSDELREEMADHI